MDCIYIFGPNLGLIFSLDKDRARRARPIYPGGLPAWVWIVGAGVGYDLEAPEGPQPGTLVGVSRHPRVSEYGLTLHINHLGPAVYRLGRGCDNK